MSAPLACQGKGFLASSVMPTQNVNVTFTVPQSLSPGQYFQYKIDWSAISLPALPSGFNATGLGFVVTTPTTGYNLDIPTEAIIGPAYITGSSSSPVMNPPAMIDSGHVILAGEATLTLGATTMLIGTTGYSCAIDGTAPVLTMNVA